MGLTLVLEIENSNVNEFVIRGVSGSRCSSQLGVEYRGSEKMLSPVVSDSESDSLAGLPGVTAAIREVVFKENEVMIIENISLNTKSPDCAPFIAGFRIQRDSEDHEAKSYGRENIRCYYNKIKQKAVIVADCRRSLPTNTIIKLEINTAPLKEFQSYRERRLYIKYCSLTFDTQFSFDSTGGCREFAMHCKIQGECSIGIDTMFEYAIYNTGIALTSYTLDNGYFLRNFNSTTLQYHKSTFYYGSSELPKLGLRIEYDHNAWMRMEVFDWAQRLDDFYSMETGFEHFDLSELTAIIGTLTFDSDFIPVLELVVYTITYTAPCYESDASYYEITPIPGFTGFCVNTETGCSVEDNVIKIPRNDIQIGSQSLSFIMECPLNAIDLNSPVNVQLRHSASSKTARPILRIHASLPSSVQLITSTISSITVTSVLDEVQVIANYMFTFTLKTPVFAGGGFQIDLSPSINLTSEASCKASIQLESCTRSGNGFFLRASDAGDHNTEVTVICEGIANPYDRGEYSGFLVTAVNADEVVVAKSEDLRVALDYRKFAASVASQVTYLKTLKQWLFNFVYEANYSEGSYSDQAVMEIIFSSHNLECDLIQVVTGNLERISDLKFKVLEAPSSSLAFNMTCKDPIAGFRLNNISFTITDESKSHRIIGNTTIVIHKETMVSIKDLLVECMHRYPRLSVKCNVTFTKVSTEFIDTIVLYGELLSPAYTYSHLPTGTCSVSVEGLQSTCTYDRLDRITITFPAPVADSSLKIIDLEYINPEGSERDDKKFSMQTFSVKLQSVVDWCGYCFTALVDCDFPCNTCQNSFTDCTSCVTGPNAVFFLMPKEFACLPSCPAKHFVDSRKACRPCVKHCASCSFRDICDTCEAGYKRWNKLCYEKCPLNTVDVDNNCTLCLPKCSTCQGTPEFCTACKNNKFSYAGECYSECVKGTGAVNSSKFKFCLPCEEGCDECTHTEGVTQSTTCTKCSSGYSSAETSPPLACVPARRLEVIID
eukprot:TRINITY_DN7150_c0_g1_i8.p1 TRINITY_DN7150_c0_g1~~TRINITY_DN7150_c0_g1_i8.p1  ORF type:complete len:1000 (+),score=57.64 TRINITY_DN7150_c0_g1_i8:404-3403(+)